MDPFIYVPIVLYICCLALYVQQAMTVVTLRTHQILADNRWLLGFLAASSVYCILLLAIFLAPLAGRNAEFIRFCFHLLWLVAPILGLFYLYALSKHLTLPLNKVRWFVSGYWILLIMPLLMGLYTLISGDAILFSHEKGGLQSRVDYHLGGVFSPSLVTIFFALVFILIVAISAAIFVREILKRETPDFSLAIGVSITVVASIAELFAYVVQWEYAFSWLPLANTVEAFRLTYLSTLQAGRELEVNRLSVVKDKLTLQSHLRSVGHDVRTPLASLKLGLGRVRSQDPANDQLIDALVSEAEYLHVVFSNIETMAGLELGEIKITEHNLDVQGVIATLVQRFSSVAQAKDVEVNFSEESLEFSLRCDPHYLEQGLSNLIYSAIIRAEARVAIVAFREGRDLVVRSIDDGSGKMPFSIPRLADRTYRNEIEKKVGSPGWALGLLIASEIAACHGGELRLVADRTSAFTAELRVPIISSVEAVTSVDVTGEGPRPGGEIVGDLGSTVSEP